MILWLDGEHHSWAGGGNCEFALDLDGVAGEVLFDVVVPQEDSSSDEVRMEIFDHHCLQGDGPVISKKSLVNFAHGR